jgi:hypothetical protein
MSAPEPNEGQSISSIESMSNASRHLKVLAILSVVLVAATELASWIGIRMTTFDDTNMAMASTESIIHKTMVMAKEQGRLQFLVGVPLWLAALYFEDTPVFDALHLGSYLLFHVLIFTYLTLRLGWRHAVVFSTFYFSTMALAWDHSILFAFPLYHFVTLGSGMLAVVLAYLADIRHRFVRWIPVSALRGFSYVLLLLSFFGPEYQLVLFTLVYSVDRLCHLGLQGVSGSWARRREVLVAVAPVLALDLGFLAAWFAFRSFFGSTYDGNQVDFSAHLDQFFPTILDFSLSSNITYWLLGFGSKADLGFGGKANMIAFTWPTRPLELLDLDLLMAQLQGADIFSMFAKVSLTLMTMGCVYFLRSRSSRTSRPFDLSFFVVLAIGACFVFVPTTLLALTSKYRMWHATGVMAYAYSPVCQFGLALIAAAVVVAVSDALYSRSRWWARAFLSLVSVYMGITGAYAYRYNLVVTDSMHANYQRWNLLQAISSVSASKLIDGTQGIYAPFLFGYFWATPTDEAYWRQYAKQKYGQQLKILRDRVGETKLTLVDYFEVQHCQGFAAVASGIFFGRAERRQMIISDSARPLFLTLADAATSEIRTKRVAGFTPLEAPGTFSYKLLERPSRVISVDCYPPRQHFEFEGIALGYEYPLIRDGDGAFLLGAGWHVGEDWGRWMAGGSGTFRIPRFDGHSKIAVTFLDVAILSADGAQTVALLYDGQPIAPKQRVKAGKHARAAFCVDTKALGPDREFKVMISAPVSPEALGFGADPRVIGFGARAVRFDPC